MEGLSAGKPLLPYHFLLEPNAVHVGARGWLCVRPPDQVSCLAVPMNHGTLRAGRYLHKGRRNYYLVGVGWQIRRAKKNKKNPTARFQGSDRRLLGGEGGSLALYLPASRPLRPWIYSRIAGGTEAVLF